MAPERQEPDYESLRKQACTGCSQRRCDEGNCSNLKTYLARSRILYNLNKPLDVITQ